MADKNERKATGNAGANNDEVEERYIPGDEKETRAEMSRRGERHQAGADTPAGPNPNSTTANAKREREKQKEIEARDRQRNDG